VIELPIREVLPEVIRLRGLVADGRAAEGADGLFVVIELPIREVLPELIRIPELADACFPALELAPAGFLLPRELLNGLRVPEAVGGRRVVGRLGVTPRG